jgi:hypothetical protein
MIVGNVLTVELHISARLDATAKIYNHHHCVSKSNPGIMIASFVPKPHASTRLALVQYVGVDIVFTA